VSVGDVVFTDRELDIMDVLWEAGPSTVADVRDQLKDDLAYTTVLTILRTLEDKGHVGHEEEGRAYRYHPLVERGEARVSAVGHMTDKLFAGRTELLLTHLVSDQDLSEDALARIRALLDERLGTGEGDE
jgi:BlaI family transcriptional regulator, penicillinase repressor